MVNIKTEPKSEQHHLRGRSPDRHDLSMQDQHSSSAPARTSKRRKRSELSPSSKATHSIIEKERREAMNEKFAELAANIPELVEAISAGKRPTKGEIVKASIARHQEQDRRVRELMHEVQLLRSGNGNGNVASQQQQQTLVMDNSTSVSAQMPALANTKSSMLNSMHYQIQSSHPVGSGDGNLWMGSLLDKAPLSLSLESTLPMLPDMAQPISPFKQSSIINPWGLPTPFANMQDPASLSIGFPSSASVMKTFLENGTLDQLAHHRDSTSSNTTPSSGFSSPTFTSDDGDSTFSSTEGAESMAFEPFAMGNVGLMEQTPLSSLVGLPATDLVGVGSGSNKSQRRNTRATRGQKNEQVKEEQA